MILFIQKIKIKIIYVGLNMCIFRILNINKVKKKV
jgi:hypothetical protein